MYQLWSVDPAFCTCAPTSGFCKQIVCVQYEGRGCRLNFTQWSNQLPQLHLFKLVPLMFVTLILSPRGDSNSPLCQFVDEYKAKSQAPSSVEFVLPVENSGRISVARRDAEDDLGPLSARERKCCSRFHPARRKF